MPVGWLLVDVSGLLGSPGLARRFDATGSIPGLRVGLGEVDESDLIAVRLQMVSTEDSIRVTGWVSGRMTLACSRCLAEYGRELDVEVREYFYFDPAMAEAKDGYEVQDESVDLEPMLRDVIVLGIPMKPVHHPDCRGLCPVCGQDLNVADCGHDEPAVDLRWAPLKGLIVGESGRTKE